MDTPRPRGRARPSWFALLLVALVVGALPARARQLVQAAYAFDIDPGPGGGTLVAVGPAGEITLPLNPAAPLTPGVHRLILRFQDDTGAWSNAEVRPFEVVTPTPLQQPVILAAEYAFTGTAPGSGTPLAVTPGAQVDLAASLATSGLPEGIHPLQLRVRDSSGRWSNAEARVFYLSTVVVPDPALIQAAEAFFDTDPGEGNGLPLTVTPGETVQLSGLLDTSGMSAGFHYLTVRVRDDDGRWSLRETRLLLLEAPLPEPDDLSLAGAEWFVNGDPGPGQGMSVPMPVDGLWDEVQENLAQDILGLPVGKHLVGLRVKDNLGRWSPTVLDSTLVGPYLHIAPAAPPAQLSWEGDLEGDLVYIHKATSGEGPWAVVDSTTASGWIDPETVPGNARRWYRVTQKLDTPLPLFRLPEPTGAGAVPNRRFKTPWETVGAPLTSRRTDVVPVQEED